MTTNTATAGAASNLKAPHASRKRNPGRPSLQEGEKALNNLYRVAMHHFLLKGLDGANIQTIAREAGVSRQMIHNRFGSKKQFFEEVTRNVETRLFFDEIDIEHRADTDDPYSVLNYIGNEMMDLFLSPDYVETFRILNVVLSQHPEVARLHARAQDRVFATIGKHLRAAAEQQNIKIEKSKKAGRDFVSLIYGLALPTIQGTSERPSTRWQRREIREIVDRFLRGLGFPARG